ncbi:MAG: acyltransferase [Mucilaginibacter sp.]
MIVLRALSAILFYTSSILSYIINYRVINLFKKAGNIMYSGWIKNRLKESKGIVNIEYPIMLHGGRYISVGKNFGVKGRLRLEAIDTFLTQSFQPEVIFGKNVFINYDCHIASINKIIIGNDVLIGSRVLITDHFHGEISSGALTLAPSLRELTSKGPVIVEDNVWIGEGAVIMPNVTIGQNAIIGANSVVTKDIPANSVVAGIPARIIKTL